MKQLTVDELEQLVEQAMAANDWFTVAQLETRLDAAAQPRLTPATVSVALWYASVGLHVFPLQATTKIPHRGTRGCKEATTDPDKIIAWWRRWPDSNVAIATGHLVDVIDIDGPAGVASWANIDDLPPVLGTVSTPRGVGGTHLYIPATGETYRAGLFPGIDGRGVGQYVVAPPSYVIERDKGYEGAYRWRRPLALPEARAAA